LEKDFHKVCAPYNQPIGFISFFLQCLHNIFWAHSDPVNSFAQGKLVQHNHLIISAFLHTSFICETIPKLVAWFISVAARSAQ
jgi:hypothetical protein